MIIQIRYHKKSLEVYALLDLFVFWEWPTDHDTYRERVYAKKKK